MTAKKLSEQLASFGIPILKVTESDDLVDGEIMIAPDVHIQVAGTSGLADGFGIVYHVVRENPDETFTFYPERRQLDTLLVDLRNALGLQQQAN